MDRDEKLGIKNAVRLYEETGVGAYTTVQRLADFYVGDGSKREFLLKRIADDQARERLSIECMFGIQQMDWIMGQPKEIATRLGSQSGYIIGLTCLYILARLEDPEEKRSAREFIEDLLTD